MENSCLSIYRLVQLGLGPVFIIIFYDLVALNLYALFRLLGGVLITRIGLWPALCWQAIGLIIIYNIVFNHILACIIKPNGPKELRHIEKLRELYKNRSNRKPVTN